MENEQKKWFAISEAKDLVLDINNAISKTREKSWQLLAFLIGINAFFITSLEYNTNYVLIYGTFTICLVFDIFISINLMFCMMPNKIISNGGYPNLILNVIKQEQEPEGVDFFTVMISNYNHAIEANTKTLLKMTGLYKKSLTGFITLCCSLFVFILLYFYLIKLN